MKRGRPRFLCNTHASLKHHGLCGKGTLGGVCGKGEFPGDPTGSCCSGLRSKTGNMKLQLDTEPVVLPLYSQLLHQVWGKQLLNNLWV